MSIEIVQKTQTSGEEGTVLKWIHKVLKEKATEYLTVSDTVTEAEAENDTFYAKFGNGTPSENDYNLKFSSGSGSSGSKNYEVSANVKVSDKVTKSSITVKATMCYVCSNGLLFTNGRNGSSAISDTHKNNMLIAKTQEGKTLVAFTTGDERGSKKDWDFQYEVFADGDKEPYVSYKFYVNRTESSAINGGNNANNATNAVNAAQNYTLLVPFTTNRELGQVSYTEKAFYMPIAQYREVGILTIDNVEYVSNGYFCIQDGD